MSKAQRLDEAYPRQGPLGLLGLVLGLMAGGAALYVVAGPPRLPNALPNWDAVLLTLRGSYLSPEVLAYLLVTAAWVVWLWIVGSILLRMLAVAAEFITHGASWVRFLRRCSDRVTPPVVRRLVDAALVAVVVVNLVGRGAPCVAATALASAAPMSVVVAGATGAPSPQVPDSRPEQQRMTQYTVQPGDTLWAIAERFYGTGQEYPRLVAANLGRVMEDGRRFTQAGVIHPGWHLDAPAPSRAVEEVAGESYYVVERGDTLRGIAARLLGDEARWTELFDANRGVARLDDGHALSDPGLIWPDLRLRLPPVAPERASEPPAPAVATQEADGIFPEPPACPGNAALPPVAVDPVGEEPMAAAESPVAPNMHSGEDPVAGESWPSLLVYGAAGVAAALAGGAALLSRRRVRRSLDEPPVAGEEETSLLASSFVEGEFARAFAHRLHGDDVDPVTLVAEQLLRFLKERGPAEISIVTSRHGRNAVELTLSAAPPDRADILARAGEFASRMGASVRAEVTPDGDIALRLSGLKLASMMAPLSTQEGDRLCLIPIGVQSARETLHVNWPELGHVLIAGAQGAGTEVLLTSLLSALAARIRPEELAFNAIASRRTLSAELCDLPHLRSVADPSDSEGVAAVLEQVRAELLARMRRAERREGTASAANPKSPEIVLVVGELAESLDNPLLELIALHGREHGVRLLASSSDVAGIEDSLISCFGCSLVLQTTDEEESIRLLGRPDAADLGTGDYLLRIDGRLPVRARGFRVSPEHLAELVRSMRAAYGGGPCGAEAVSDATGSGAADGNSSRDSNANLQGDASSRESQGDDTIHESAGPTQGATPSVGVPSSPSSDETTASSPEDLARGVGVPISTDPAGDPLDHSAESRSEPLMSAAEEPIVSSSRQEEDSVQGTPVQISCFGGFSVTSGEREITPNSDEGTSFKGWEVLAYLACQPDGAAAKDRLLEAIWPEVDEERAANRMRVAMARLRGLLSRQVPGLTSEAVRCDRDGTCRLEIGMILSDVHQFTSLCRSASRLPTEQARVALQHARSLYGGDLLHGTSYVWADERGESGLSLRESYREEYYRATQRLAKLHCHEGEPARAVPLYRALLKAEPTLEDVVRELYRCFGQLGDLSSLVREDRHLRQALREAYYDPGDSEDDPNCYQPEPETVEVFNRVKRDLVSRDPATIAQASGQGRCTTERGYTTAIP
jgi:two-component SAPR family response regulator